MKSIFFRLMSTFLTIIMILTFTSCNIGTNVSDNSPENETNASDNNTDGIQIEQNEVTGEAQVNASIEKLLESENFNITFNQSGQSANGMTIDTKVTGTVIKNINGTHEAILESSSQNEGVDRTTILYSNGIQAISRSSYSMLNNFNETNLFFFSDSNVDMGLYILQKEFSANIYNDNYINDFFKSDFDIKKDSNGNTIYLCNDLTFEDLFAMMTGMEITDQLKEEANAGGYHAATIEAWVAVFENGCFKEFGFRLNIDEPAPEYNDAVKFSYTVEITNVNSADPINEEKKLSADASKLSAGSTIYYVENNNTLLYTYNTRYNAGIIEEYLSFTGVEPSLYSPTVVPIAKVKSEILGIPVINVISLSSFYYNGSSYIEKLIIPEGVVINTMQTHAAYEESEIFFEYERPADKDIYYTLTGEDNPKNYIQFKNVYYKGEWEIVDGVPTPKS